MPESSALIRGIIVPGKAIERIGPVVTRIRGDAVSERMKYHKMVLESMNITDLASLGKMSIHGTVIPTPGLMLPSCIGQSLGPLTLVQSARRFKTSSAASRIGPERPIVTALAAEKVGGRAHLLPSKKFHSPPVTHRRVGTSERPHTGAATLPPAFRSELPIDVCYWAASWIELEDNTTVVFQQPNRWLVIITPKLTVGSNVMFTWERKEKGIPNPPETPRKPAKAATPDSIHGRAGISGALGIEGNPGWPGDPGTEIELWVVDMNGSPMFDVAGQNGFEGGKGGNGGSGGDGADGRNWISEYGGLGCKSGPGNGGNGGKGGMAGKGGPGGAGGDGGRFMFFAPDSILSQYSSGFFVDVSGGTGGRGGDPGEPGVGGAGGSKGRDRPNIGCPTSSPRSSGSRGPRGDINIRGENGPDGGHLRDAIQMTPITTGQFNTQFQKPAILNLTPAYAKEGDTVVASGMRFSNSDVVAVDGIRCQTSVSSDTILSFIVPASKGGVRPVQVIQADSTLSNKATLVIQPTLEYATQNGGRSDSTPPTRFRPGSYVRLVGTGFSPDMRVRLIDEDVTGSDVRFIDAHNMEFKVKRPISTPRQPDGEPITCSVLLSELESSNQITIILDTYLIVVLGDSIQWGQGLVEASKFHTLVEKEITNRESDIGVYKYVFAHSGAIIGNNVTTELPPLDGEVPTPYPTILQQLDEYHGNPDAVDLVLIDGGINDVGVECIVNPFSEVSISEVTRKYCYQDMKTLVDATARKFNKAKIVVTGYYQIVSHDSDLTGLTAILVALGAYGGAAVAGAVGAVVVGTVVAVISSELRDTMIQRSARFHTDSKTNIEDAVREMNQVSGYQDRILFAQPDFRPGNAIFASDSWLYGIGIDLSPEDTPPTGVSTSRSSSCEAAGSERTSVEICERASVGHPNADGAKEYARAILSVLFP